ncbi:hypothetical protein [Streptomyces sp. NPDC058247]
MQAFFAISAAFGLGGLISLNRMAAAAMRRELQERDPCGVDEPTE